MTTNDTLPDLSAEYRVSPAQVENYRRDGHILLRNICSPDEIAAYGPVITESARRLNDDSRPMEERNTFDRAFTLAAGLWTQDESVRRFTLARVTAAP